ncbi:unnamed protein product [Larinioides sclopetarius]|uniref:Uncharacterized protein n=1 Tax=Larinioides sclopetarius TaxID=280406 RepID=A0AAV2BBS9_9ARAC
MIPQSAFSLSCSSSGQIFNAVARTSGDERKKKGRHRECLNDFSPDCSAEGLKYLAGYIAHKCRKYDRSLAIPSGQSLAISSKEKTWIEVLSRGDLLIPTDKWFEQIKKFEETFIEMHAERIVEFVTEAPSKIFGLQSRDGFTSATFESRKHM